MSKVIIFFISIAISMDTFSLSLAYGIKEDNNKKIAKISLLVGLFHFFMPLFGSIIGNRFIKYITNTNKIISLIFIILAIQMYNSRNEERNAILTTFLSIITFALSVSIDSFSIGFALSMNNINLLPAFMFFAIVSGLMTLSGFLLGKYIYEKIGNKSIYIGIILLLMLSVKYMFT